MDDYNKTKEQLVTELAAMRRQLAALKRRSGELERANEQLRQENAWLRLAETRLKQENEKLLSSHEQFSLLQKSLPVVNFSCEVGGNFDPLYVSSSLTEVTGYEPKEFLTQPSFWADRIHPDDRVRVLRKLSKLLKKGFLEHKYRWRVADGSYKTLYEVIRVVKTPGGEVSHLVGAFHDNTLQQRALESLRESEERYRLLVELSPDVIVLFSDFKIKFINSTGTRNLGAASTRELIGRSILDFIHPDDRETVLKRAALLETGKHPPVIKIKFLRLDGTVIYGESGAVPITYQGKPAVQVIIRDFTERKIMEEKALQGIKLESLGILAGGFAHDFNNILMSAILNLHISLMQLNPQGEIFKYLTRVESALIKGKNLTHQLLTFSKSGTPAAKSTTITQLIEDSARFVLTGSKTGCEFFIANDLWPVKIDEGPLVQVINNLIINADQAMPKGGVINVYAENITADHSQIIPLEKGNYVKISVKDYGTGIPKEILKEIFKPNFTTKDSGSGFGLAVCQAIIKNHSGYINVESKPGIGSTFQVYLPASKKPAPAQKSAVNTLFKGNGRILVMDDEEDIRNAVGQALNIFGYEVDFAQDGVEAVGLYKKARLTGQPFDLVIMDLTIPGGMGARETIRQLLKIDPKIKAIVSSGYTSDPVIKNFKKYGFRNAIKKPFGIKRLNEIINQLMKN